MHITRRTLGQLGERLVATALERRGFTVLGRNVRTRYGEVDIIVRKGARVLFVEVKTRRSRSYGYPEESITALKRIHLLRCAHVLEAQFARGCTWGILIVAVEISPMAGTATLHRIELDY